MLCVVCKQPAVVWCHNDEAALCTACDVAVHSVGPLAWKHKRTRLSSGAPLAHLDNENGSHQPEASQNKSQAAGAAIAVEPPAHVSENEQESAKQHSFDNADIPFMTDVEKGAAASFDINKLVDEFKAAGDSFDVNGIMGRGLEVGIGSLDLLNLPLMPSFDVLTDNLPHVVAASPRQDAAHPAEAGTSATLGATAAAQASTRAKQQPDEQVDSPAEAEHAPAGGNSTGSASSLITLRDCQQPQMQAETAPSTAAAAKPEVTPAMALPAAAPAAALPMPATSVMPQHVMPVLMAAFPADPCMAYIPATLQPKTPDAREAAREKLHERRQRFRQKKALQTQKKAQPVRYISRKVYADTRPRINGRFIRKDSSSS